MALLLWLALRKCCCQPAQTLQFIVVLIVVAFILVGASVFQALEREKSREMARQTRQTFKVCLQKWLAIRRFSGDDLTVDEMATNCLPASLFYDWTFSDSVLFTFSVVTTIGYGNVVPRTFLGRLFCCFYALVGIPLTMIALANIGKYLAALFKNIEQKMLLINWDDVWIFCFGRSLRKRRMLWQRATMEPPKETAGDQLLGKTFLCIFIVYLLCGSFMLEAWESDLDTYTTAVYFNLLSLTTIGIGDFWPKNQAYLAPTMCYLAIGLAITTIAFDMASDCLRKLHFYGQKVKNMKNILIPIGSRKISVGGLIGVVCVQLGVAAEAVANLDLDEIIQQKFDSDERGEVEEQPQNRTPPAPATPPDLEEVERQSLLDENSSDTAPESVVEITNEECQPTCEVYHPLHLTQLQHSCVTEIPDQNVTFGFTLLSPKAILAKIDQLHMPLPEMASVTDVQLAIADTAQPIAAKEAKIFTEKHKTAIRKIQNPAPGRSDFQHDAQKSYEIYKKEWERIDAVKAKVAEEELKKKRRLLWKSGMQQAGSLRRQSTSSSYDDERRGSDASSSQSQDRGRKNSQKGDSIG